MTKKIFIIRHGRTYLNKYDRMQGWTDTPLTEDGITGAKHIAQVLKDVPFDAALSSDLKRASDTAKYIIDANVNHDKLNLVSTYHFREALYGYFEGMNSQEAWYLTANQHGYQNKRELIRNEGYNGAKNLMHEADPFHDAETAEQYWERVEIGFDLIKAMPKDVENILLVSHSNTISSIVEKYGKGKFNVEKGPANSSITIMEIDDNNEMEITSFNKLELD